MLVFLFPKPRYLQYELSEPDAGIAPSRDACGNARVCGGLQGCHLWPRQGASSDMKNEAQRINQLREEKKTLQEVDRSITFHILPSFTFFNHYHAGVREWMDGQRLNSSGQERTFPFGAGMTNADVEIFEKLRYLPSLRVHRIFEIGNAFGYSTALLGSCVVSGTLLLKKTGFCGCVQHSNLFPNIWWFTDHVHWFGNFPGAWCFPHFYCFMAV